MDNAFLRHQLGALHCIEPEAIELLFQLLREEPVVARGLQWINEDSEILKTCVIADGWAMRYKVLEDGRRQILNFLTYEKRPQFRNCRRFVFCGW
jgi:hypothetical protein